MTVARADEQAVASELAQQALIVRPGARAGTNVQAREGWTKCGQKNPAPT